MNVNINHPMAQRKLVPCSCSLGRILGGSMEGILQAGKSMATGTRPAAQAPGQTKPLQLHAAC